MARPNTKPGLSAEADRVAAELLTEHGAAAEFVAALQADAALDAGDLDTQARWIAVPRAVDDMQRPEKRTAELEHQGSPPKPACSAARPVLFRVAHHVHRTAKILAARVGIAD